MNILITGASRGIGRETAKQFALIDGNRVLALSRNEVKLGELRSECEAIKSESQLIPLPLDLTSNNLKGALLPILEGEFDHIDILINNAGFLVNKPFVELESEDVEKVFNTNLFSVIKLIQLLLPFMGKDSKTSIVNIGSMGGYQGSDKFTGLSAYSASKGALSTLSECLAEEFKEMNINVNCLALGGVNTEMLHQAFPGYEAPINPEEIARYIVDFCGGEGMRTSGRVIVPDLW